MKYLVDTCVISELIKTKPDEHVVSWILNNDEQDLYLSILTIGEIHKGIEKVMDRTRKVKLQQWVEHDLKERFANRILMIDIDVATIWGQIQGKAELKGKPMPAIDSLIAATALARDMTDLT